MIIVQKKNTQIKRKLDPRNLPIWEDIAYFVDKEAFTEEEKNNLRILAEDTIRILTVSHEERFKIKTAIRFEKIDIPIRQKTDAKKTKAPTLIDEEEDEQD